MYEVTANLCDGSEYVRFWSAGTYASAEEAISVWDAWWPPQDEVLASIDDGGEVWDLQIGVWGECGQCVAFHSEHVP